MRIRSQYKIVDSDPDDDFVINTAISGKAEYIITGDKHLLALEGFRNIQMVTVSQMIEIVDRM